MSHTHQVTLPDMHLPRGPCAGSLSESSMVHHVVTLWWSHSNISDNSWEREFEGFVLGNISNNKRPCLRPKKWDCRTKLLTGPRRHFPLTPGTGKGKTTWRSSLGSTFIHRDRDRERGAWTPWLSLWFTFGRTQGLVCSPVRRTVSKEQEHRRLCPRCVAPFCSWAPPEGTVRLTLSDLTAPWYSPQCIQVAFLRDFRGVLRTLLIGF